MPVLEGLATTSKTGYQLECNRCRSVYKPFKGRLRAFREAFKVGWTVEKDEVILCPTCGRRKTRYEVLVDAFT